LVDAVDKLDLYADGDGVNGDCQLKVSAQI